MADKTIKVRSPARKVNLPGRNLAVKRFAVNRMMNPRAQFIRVRGNFSYATAQDNLTFSDSSDGRNSDPESYAESKVYDASRDMVSPTVKTAHKAVVLIQSKQGDRTVNPLSESEEDVQEKQKLSLKRTETRDKIIKLRDNKNQDYVYQLQSDILPEKDYRTPDHVITVRQSKGEGNITIDSKAPGVFFICVELGSLQLQNQERIHGLHT